MPLPSGQYKITCSESGLSIGRDSMSEDKSSGPKKIVPLPPKSPSSKDVFEITKIDEAKGLYRIKCDGGILSSRDLKLYAFLEAPEKQDDWLIAKAPNEDSLDPLSQGQIQTVRLGPVAIMPTDPPGYLPMMIFEFTPVGDFDTNGSDFSDSEEEEDVLCLAFRGWVCQEYWPGSTQAADSGVLHMGASLHFTRSRPYLSHAIDAANYLSASWVYGVRPAGLVLNDPTNTMITSSDSGSIGQLSPGGITMSSTA
ncbi:hypothetical protein NLI96_g12347 [Meripilus lineatus]|uniref:Uncharacterized protein n=1 Tax=Meripilus lineatus TaxID=2056292 RepID=A0AAD5YCH3_9APHY|nr:hypothetical protein NLI96_g12347 [Physisporinus lineatus]